MRILLSTMIAPAMMALVPSSALAFASQLNADARVEGAYAMEGAGTSSSGDGLLILPVDQPYVLFKNGWARVLDASPDQFDPDTGPAREPKKWARWERRGGTPTLLRDGRTYRGRVLPAIKAGELSGKFVRGSGASSASGGSSHVFSGGALTFDAGGRFRWNRSVGAGSPSSGARSTREAGGSYRIEGFSMEMRYDDGRTSRSAVAWNSPRARDAFYLNGALWIARK